MKRKKTVAVKKIILTNIRNNPMAIIRKANGNRLIVRLSFLYALIGAILLA
ncbi:MAG: hypothetical protein H3Z53_02820 [archaeon]|nr:hypothetical protein [archaeon]